jgi:hypothetical protein
MYRIPYTSVYPMAIRAYTLPRATPSTTKLRQASLERRPSLMVALDPKKTPRTMAMLRTTRTI